MGFYNNPNLGAAELRKWEDMLAKQEQMQADMDYLAMMADVEMEDETEAMAEEEG